MSDLPALVGGGGGVLGAITAGVMWYLTKGQRASMRKHGGFVTLSQCKEHRDIDSKRWERLEKLVEKTAEGVAYIKGRIDEQRR